MSIFLNRLWCDILSTVVTKRLTEIKIRKLLNNNIKGSFILRLLIYNFILSDYYGFNNSTITQWINQQTEDNFSFNFCWTWKTFFNTLVLYCNVLLNSNLIMSYWILNKGFCRWYNLNKGMIKKLLSHWDLQFLLKFCWSVLEINSNDHWSN